MKRPRAPYAKRSVWNAVAILSVVLVAACVVAGLEINHLRNQINGLQTQVNSLGASFTNLYQEFLKLAAQVKK